jgi:ketosteroid isomerase-like protein
VLAVSCAGAVTWLTADTSVTGQTGGQAVSLGAYRVTYVFEQRGNQWLIVHGHISVVANGE